MNATSAFACYLLTIAHFTSYSVQDEYVSVIFIVIINFIHFNACNCTLNYEYLNCNHHFPMSQHYNGIRTEKMMMISIIVSKNIHA